jgi:hypothetical protein
MSFSTFFIRNSIIKRELEISKKKGVKSWFIPCENGNKNTRTAND